MANFFANLIQHGLNDTTRLGSRPPTLVSI